jgi:hypothetical protein
MKETLFRFNPFTIAEWSPEQVKQQYDIFAQELVGDDTQMVLANDIDVYANMGYLIGEMIARYSKDVSNMEATLKVNIANTIYRERNQYVEEHKNEKAPAMSYFENRALSQYLEETKVLNEKEAFLKRFKYAYDSIQDKQNALKKKLDSVRFDLLGR